MRILQFLCLGLLLIACDENNKALPKSTGSANEIIVVVSDAIWEKYPSEAIKNIFSKDYPGLQQSEPVFNVIRINPADFSSIFKTHQNIILISENGEEGKRKDVWASPQLLVKMNWSPESNKTQFAANCEQYARQFYQNQLQKIRQKHTISKQKTTNKFGMEFYLPSEYSIVENNPKLFWATYNPKNKDLIKQLLVFNFKINEINFHENLIEKVDSVLAKTLKGRAEDNFVKIEKRFPLEISANTYRGLWKMENDFMGGPFLMRIKNQKEGDITIAIGIVFAPGETKKRFMIEMDAVL